MSNFWKVIFTAVAVLIVCGTLFGIIKAGAGNYFLHASFVTSGLLLIGSVVLIYLVYKGIKFIWTLILVAAVLQSCNYATSRW